MSDVGNIGLALEIAKVPVFVTSICITSLALLYVYDFGLMAFHKMVFPEKGRTTFVDPNTKKCYIDGSRNLPKFIENSGRVQKILAKNRGADSAPPW